MPSARRRHRSGAVALGVLLLAASRETAASPPYPAEIEKTLGSACAPQCTICHLNDEGGPDTAVQDFAVALQGGHGLEGGVNLAALRGALSSAESAGLDVDGDDVPDIDELTLGTNPNDPEDGPACGAPEPEHGCTCRVGSSRRSTPDGLAGAGALAVALALLAGPLGLRRRKVGRAGDRAGRRSAARSWR